MNIKFSKRLWILVILCILADQVDCRRGGGSFGVGSRGSSGARASSGHSGGGLGSIGRSTGYTGRSGTGMTSGRHTGGGYAGGNNYGTKSGSGIFGSRSNIGRNNNYNRGTSSGGGFLGGLGRRNNNYGRSSSGIGRSGFGSTFKNAIVGAAAGYLAYQGGKYLIRSAMAPMMYNNRPYYWGSQHYQSRPNTQMCRQPMDPNDQQMGNIYFQDNTRPKEIVWGCGMHEHCCGSDCCPNNGGGNMPMGGGSGMGMGGGMSQGGMSLPAQCKIDGTGFEISLRPAQSVGVRGTLKCNGMPASGVLVKLFDHDTFTLDDKIAEGRTDGQGNFCIAGHANEITTITPKFNIYHDCNDFLPCQRKISMYVPKTFVSQGNVPYNIYDAGVMELSAKLEGESRDCLHK